MARGLIALLLAFADTARAFHARNALGRDGALRSATTDNEPIPPSALVTQAVDEATFEEERRRYSDFAADGSLPRAFARYLTSVRRPSLLCHTFEPSGACLEDHAWESDGLDDDATRASAWLSRPAARSEGKERISVCGGDGRVGVRTQDVSHAKRTLCH